jgi:hypothetical protein
MIVPDQDRDAAVLPARAAGCGQFQNRHRASRGEAAESPSPAFGAAKSNDKGLMFWNA